MGYIYVITNLLNSKKYVEKTTATYGELGELADPHVLGTCAEICV
jgi:hypothetical protein